VVAGTPEVRQFPGGASNLTYLLRYPGGDLILRRPPRGTKAKGAHDMGREYRVQAALAPVFPRVPAMVGLCEDESVIGSEFYVMEKVDGTILRQDFPPELDLTIEDVNLLCGNAIDVLIELHQVDPATPGRAEFERGAGYVERQVGGWTKRFRAARTDDVGDFEPVMAWLEANRPGDVGHCVIHNDFRFDNLVLAPGDPMRIVGVLDWEMATLGDPLMDLAGSMAYWVQADDSTAFQAMRRVPTHLPGMLTREEFVDRYCERMGLSVTPEQWRFYEVFGLFRLAVIAQQIYYRFVQGQTTNEAYGLFGHAVRMVDSRITELMSR
jgi:aminoglycoside phosphotransferase (APT) family kinase protein